MGKYWFFVPDGNIEIIDQVGGKNQFFPTQDTKPCQLVKYGRWYMECDV